MSEQFFCSFIRYKSTENSEYILQAVLVYLTAFVFKILKWPLLVMSTTSNTCWL